MSTFSQYGIGNLDVDTIVADESYSGLAGAYRMAEENLINENHIFEAIIHRDFSEVACEAGMISESSLEIVNEASLSGIWEKVVAFFESVGKKILGIIKNLVDKIQSVFIRDGKELVKKYSKQIGDKFASSASGITKMKYKYAEFHNDAAFMAPTNSAVKDVFETSKLSGAINYNLSMAMDNKELSGTESDNTTKDDIRKSTDPDEKGSVRPYTEDEKTEFTRNLYHDILGEGNPMDDKDFKAAFWKQVFSDPTDHEGMTEGFIKELEDVLTTGGDAIKSLSKDKDATEKNIKAYKDAANKVSKEMAKKKSESLRAALSNAYANRVITLTTIASSVTGQALALKGEAYKKQMKQARSLYIKAATTGVRESVEFFDAIDEVSNYEVDEMFA